MNIPNVFSTKVALPSEPADNQVDVPVPHARGEPFYMSHLRYDQVKNGQEYYIMYQYRSVVDDSLCMAFQVGTCKLNVNYSRTGWMFMFVDVTNVYDAMNDEDRELLLPVVFLDTRISAVCDAMNGRDIARMMEGHPGVIGALRRYMWLTQGQHQYMDLGNTQRRFNLNVFNKTI